MSVGGVAVGLGQDVGDPHGHPRTEESQEFQAIGQGSAPELAAAAVLAPRFMPSSISLAGSVPRRPMKWATPRWAWAFAS